VSVTRPDWETLNAYVDGELPIGAAAKVARALAEDRVLAAAVATLTRLKAATHEVGGDHGVVVSRPAAPGWRGVAMVAAMVALFIAGTVFMIPYGKPSAPPWLAQAWGVHAAWTGDEGAAGDSGRVLAAMSRVGAQAYLPDLSAASLSLTRLEPLAPDIAGRGGMHLGYRGNRGCQLSLLILGGGDGLPTALTRFGQGRRQIFGWRSATHGYVLMAEGMDDARLGVIARSVYQGALRRAPFDDATRTALRHSREVSAPCLS